MVNVKTMKGSYLCELKRSRKLELKESENPNFRRIEEEKNIIKRFKHLPQVYTSMEEAVNACDTFMANEKEFCEITRQKRAEEMKALVGRYLAADSRVCVEPASYAYKFGGKSYVVKPDFVFEDITTIKARPRKKMIKKGAKQVFVSRERTEIEVPIIEIVHLSAAKTKMSNSPRSSSLDTGMFANLTVFGSVMYGKYLLRGREGVVKVTFDSLKSGNDKNGDFSSPWQVCEEGKTSKKTDNSVSLEFVFSKKGAIIPYGNTNGGYFDKVKKSIEVFETSTSCSKMECQKCDRYPICHYNHPPKSRDEEVIEKKGNDISLTGQQEKVITFREGIARVLAGPGSGKTFCLVERVISLVQSGVNPKNILVTTFSRAGIQEFRERLARGFQELGLKKSPSDVSVANFNSLGNSLIMKYYKELGFTEIPVLLDEVEEKNLISEVISEGDREIVGLDYRNPTMKFSKNAPKGIITYLYDEFNFIRNNTIEDFDEYIRVSSSNSNVKVSAEDKKIIWSMYRKFSALMIERGYIDYADQSNLVMKLIYLEEEFGKKYVSNFLSYEHIIVDEFQDSNEFQLTFIKELISTPKFVSLMCVGDDKQAIYGFRGTSPDNILRMSELLDVATEDLLLTQTHRFPQTIADVGNFVISKNDNQVKAEIVSTNPNGEKPIFKSFDSEKQEYKYIAESIKTLIDGGVEPSDIAVISQTNSTLSSVGKELTELGVLSLKNMERILDNSRVLAVINLCKFLSDFESTANLAVYINAIFDGHLMDLTDRQINELIRINQEGFLNNYLPLSLEERKEMLIKLIKALEDGTDDTYSEFVKKIEKKTRYDERGLVEYILKYAFYDTDDRVERKEKYNSVELTTAHGSKGKEWKYVFVTMSDFDRGLSSEEIDERRRLLFVAVTRAKDFLTITSIREITSSAESTRIHKFYGEFLSSSRFSDLFDAAAERSA